jgi:O-Antigen ligase
MTFSRKRTLLMAGAVGCAGSLLLVLVSTFSSPIMAMVATLGVAVCVGMMFSPFWATLALAASLPFERIGRLTDDTATMGVSASRILGLIALASLLLCVALKRKKLHVGLPVLLYAGYVLVGALSYTWAYSPEETFRDIFRVLGNLLFFFLIVNTVRDYSTARKVVLVWLFASLAAAVYSLGGYYFSSGNPVAETEMGLQSTRSATVVMDFAEARSLAGGVRRLFGTTGHPTLFGLNMTMTVPFLFWAFRSSRSWWWKMLWLAGLPIAVASIFLSNTRAVMLLAVGTILFCIARQLWRLNLPTIVALVVIGAVAAPFIPKDIYMRTLDPAMYTSGKGDAIRVRLKFWGKSWDLIAETWGLGIGLGNETTLVDRITDENTGFLSTNGLRASAHNEFIWVLAEVGIVGYVFFFGFVGYTLFASFRAGSLLRRMGDTGEQYLFCLACQTLLIGMPFFALQSEPFHYPLKGWWLTTAISCTMLEVARRQLASQTQPEAEIPTDALEPVQA